MTTTAVGDLANAAAAQRARAEAAEKRVKELEALLDAADIQVQVQAHKLVVDVVAALRTYRREMEEHGVSSAELIRAPLLAMDAAGITVQPVRTYTREEAEALWYAIEKRHEKEVGFGWTEFRDEIVSLIMSVPVAQAADTDRVKRLEAALRDFAEHGTRFDLTPTVTRTDQVSLAGEYMRYIKRIDESVRARAELALEWHANDGTPNPYPVTPPAPRAQQGHDEAGGEGLAAAPDMKPGEVERLLDEAEGFVSPRLIRIIRILDERTRGGRP